MALGTAVELYAHVRTKLVRLTGGVLTDDEMSDLILVLESDLIPRARVRAMLTKTSGTWSGNDLAVPARFREMIAITFDDGTQIREAIPEGAGMISVIEDRITSADGEQLFVGLEDVSGTLNIVVSPDPDGDTYELWYLADVVGLASSASNGIYDKYPGVYVNGLAAEAALHVQDVDVYSLYAARYEAYLLTMNQNEKEFINRLLTTGRVPRAVIRP